MCTPPPEPVMDLAHLGHATAWRFRDPAGARLVTEAERNKGQALGADAERELPDLRDATRQVSKTGGRYSPRLGACAQPHLFL